MDPEAYFQTSGTLSADAPSYVARAADGELLAALKRGELCYVLNARQMGKSSLCIRTRKALEESGVRTTLLDLQKFGSSGTPEQWFKALHDRIAYDLKLRAPMALFWREHEDRPPVTRLFDALREVFLEQVAEPLVIFIDEIDAVRGLCFSTDELFAAIRACRNARTEDPAYHRLTFCLIGAVAPSDLVQDVRLSPFNVGTRIRLTDFTLAEAAPLAGPLPGETKTLERVLHWTGGHPYLTHLVCAELTKANASGVDAMVSRLFFAKSDTDVDESVKNVRNAVLRLGGEGAGFDRTDLLTRYEAIVRGKRVPDDDTDAVCTALRLSGLVTSRDGKLQPRCRIYATIFDAAWVRANLPDAEVRRQRAAVAIARWQIGGIAAAVLLAMGTLMGWAMSSQRRAEKSAEDANRLVYISSSNLAQRAMEDNNYGVAQSLLEDMRRLLKRSHHLEAGYEWTYLNELMHTELLELQGHSDGVISACFSPDGRRILTGSDDKTARVWDASTGREILQLKGHSFWIASVCFSPDGRRILTGSDDKTARVWDASTGREILQLKGHSGGVNSVCFSSDGKRILTGSDDKTARVWDASTGREMLQIKGHDDRVKSVCFSFDGRRILTGSNDETARVWNASTGREILQLKGHSFWIASVCFSFDGRRILTGSNDETARVWDASTGREVLQLKGHRGPILSVCFSPDGRRVLTGSYDKTARIWDASTSRDTLQLKGHSSLITSACFSQDGRHVLTGSWDTRACVWDASTGREVIQFKGLSPILSVCFSPDGRRILTGSYDKTARVWDASTGKETLQLKGHGDRVNSVCFSPDGRRILTGSYDKTARVWDASTGKETLQLKGHSGGVNSACFSSDGKRILTGGDDKTAIVWDASTGRDVLQLKGHGDSVNSVCFSLDGRHILTGSNDETARVWDASTGQATLQLKGHNGWVNSVCFSEDGRYILTGGDDKTARVWDASTGREMLQLKGNSNMVTSVAFSPDGTRILTGSWDKTARVWRRATDAQLVTMERYSSVDQGIAQLSQWPLAEIAPKIRALIHLIPEQRYRLALPLNEIAWGVVDPAKPAPAAEAARYAREVAELAVQYSNGKNGLILDTLAAAHCACGDLASAHRVEREAVRLLPENAELKANLARYEKLSAVKGIR